MVGLSFTEQAADVLYLQEQLGRHGAEGLPIMAKIETAHAVSRLPDIIARSLARNIDLGILIARCDLAIELGSFRMAEIQEEILWLSEAAHVPVIWATQVFKSLARKGVASRPEITDAAMVVRAECVMLNKGPYIQNAVSILSDVLQRMEAHQFKKISLLWALHW
jgi:pyruvate kinase